MKKNRLLKLAFCFTLFNLSFTGYSQCDLNFLEKEYNIGRFEEVNDKLRACLKTFEYDQIQYQAGLRLLAMNSIMMDDMNQANIDVNALLDFNQEYVFGLNDPFIFKKLVKRIRNIQGVTVTSVSKFKESLDEAPATVFVITAKQIRNRGYLDLEQVFHDLPGFSISRGNGPSYSTIYPRGYRSTTNDKFLLLIDGIEENDLNSDNAIVNRQIALSNIKQIEVIYGPSSTMYGANAFAAVINIITNDADNFKDGNKLSGNIQTNYGTWNTHFTDATINYKLREGYVSLTGRYFHSDEMNLDNDDYKYNDNPSNFDYISEIGDLTGVEATEFINDNADSMGYFIYDNTVGNESVSLTQLGANKMKTSDQAFYDQIQGNDDLGFNNRVDNWYVNLKVKFNENLTIGLESYRDNSGGLPWYKHRIASKDLTRWITWNNFLNIKYQKKINSKLLLTNQTSYRLHTIDGNTNLSTIKTYQHSSLDFNDLLEDKDANLSTTFYYRSSNQIRNETKLFYKKNKFNLITGLELRQGIFQGDYLKSIDALPNETIPATTNVGVDGGNNATKLDVGLYAQGKYEFTNNLSMTLGGRLDYNKLRSTGGYGFVFNPRAALVYTKKNKYTLKAIYSEAFKDPSFLQKYSNVGTRISNPNLVPEKVKNIEISAIIKPVKDFSVELSAFNSYYSNIVAEIIQPNGDTKNESAGEVQVLGIQSQLSYQFNELNLWANYSFTQPIDKSRSDGKIEDQRVSDIPAHSFNIGANYLFLERINLNLRANYVGERETGVNTYPSENSLDLIESYINMHANLNFEILKGVNLGVLINNLLDEKYNHPGVRTANGNLASIYPQNSRTIMFRANFQF